MAVPGRFETDAAHVTGAVLHALERAGQVPAEQVAKAIAAYGIDPEAIDPLHA